MRGGQPDEECVGDTGFLTVPANLVGDARAKRRCNFACYAQVEPVGTSGKHWAATIVLMDQFGEERLTFRRLNSRDFLFAVYSGWRIVFENRLQDWNAENSVIAQCC